MAECSHLQVSSHLAICVRLLHSNSPSGENELAMRSSPPYPVQATLHRGGFIHARGRHRAVTYSARARASKLLIPYFCQARQVRLFPFATLNRTDMSQQTSNSEITAQEQLSGSYLGIALTTAQKQPGALQTRRSIRKQHGLVVDPQHIHLIFECSLIEGGMDHCSTKNRPCAPLLSSSSRILGKGLVLGFCSLRANGR